MEYSQTNDYSYSSDYPQSEYEDYDAGNSYLGYRPDPISQDPDLVPSKAENAFSPEEIAVMKKKFEDKLKKDFPKRNSILRIHVYWY